MNAKIFVQDVCPNCQPAKELGEKLKTEGFNVTFYDIKTADGLTEAVYHDIMSTPSIVVTDNDGKELHCWRGAAPGIDDIRSRLEG